MALHAVLAIPTTEHTKLVALRHLDVLVTSQTHT